MAVSVEQLDLAVYATHDVSTLSDPSCLIDGTTGDLQGREHVQILEYINNCAALSIQDARARGFENPTEIVQATITLLQEGRENYREYVNNPKNYEEGASERILERYRRVDAQTIGKSPRERMIARMNSGAGIIWVTDMDGSITKSPDEYLMHIPGSGKVGSGLAEDLLGELGRDEFIRVFAQVWHPILKQAPAIFREAGRTATPLEGTKELFQHLHRKGVPIHIDSANFMPVADEFVRTHLPVIDGEIHIWAITDKSIISTDKGNVLKDIALQYPEYAVFHTGDSDSDKDSLQAEPYLGGFLARAGLGFEKVLMKKGSLYLPYKTHHDTLSLIQEAEAAKERN